MTFSRAGYHCFTLIFGCCFSLMAPHLNYEHISLCVLSQVSAAGVKVDLFVNEGFNRQSLCPNVSWHLVLLQLGLLRAVQAVQSCLWLCSRMWFSLSSPSDQRDDDRAAGGLTLVLVWPHFGWGLPPKFFSSGEGTGLSWEPHYSFLFLLLLHLPAFTSLSCFGASLFSRDTRHADLCPCDVTFHQTLPDYVIFLQNLVFGPAWTGPAGAADPHQSVEMAHTRGGSWMGFMNRIHHNFTQSPHEEQLSSVTLEGQWGNHELLPESAIVLFPTHWKCPVNREMNPLWTSSFLS